MTIRTFTTAALPAGAALGFTVVTYGIATDRVDHIASGATMMIVFMIAMLLESIRDVSDKLDRLGSQSEALDIGSDLDAEVARLSALYDEADARRGRIGRALMTAVDRRDGRIGRRPE